VASVASVARVASERGALFSSRFLRASCQQRIDGNERERHRLSLSSRDAVMLGRNSFYYYF